MSLRVAVQMDHISTIQIGGDSTFAMLLEASRRGHILYHYVPNQLMLLDGKVLARVAPLTVQDVLFTLEKTVQPAIKSPERANWEGVTVSKVDDTTITFTLTKPYAQFLQHDFCPPCRGDRSPGVRRMCVQYRYHSPPPDWPRRSR